MKGKKAYAAPSSRAAEVRFDADLLASAKGTLPGPTGWNEEKEGRR